MPSAKREQLIDTALEIFNRDGFHATGVDRIIEEAGVARMTLYKHFKSKDELILAVMRRRDENFRNWFMRTVERRASSGGDRLLAVFDVLGDWFTAQDFSGCMFINASAEFGRWDDPIHRAASDHKYLVRDYLRDLARTADADDPEALADDLALLVEGAIIRAYVMGDREGAAGRAKRAAAILINAATG